MHEQPRARDIVVAAIARADADRAIKRLHYSHSVVRNSQVSLGVFLDGKLEGAMQFGPSMDKSKLVGLVADTPWNGFIELNRLAFSDRLPRNSESRALGVAMRMLRKTYPHLQWVVSFADGTACGDGTIYRASGFTLTGITRNKTIVVLPDGVKSTNLVLTANWNDAAVIEHCRRLGIEHKYRGIGEWKTLGLTIAPGFQMRYVFFLDPSARARLTVPPLPFSAIADAGAEMYRGQSRGKHAMAGDHPAQRRGSADLRAPSSPPGTRAA